MSRFELAPFNGQYSNRGVLARIRRGIAGRINQEECVLVDLENVRIDSDQLAFLMADWPPERVRFCGAAESLRYSLPAGVTGTYCSRQS